ncbi:MAG: Trm112 family protein [Tepidisphaeraceae bacterium]
MNQTRETDSIAPDLLEILRCPLTRSRLRREGDWLIAEVGGLSYPIRDGIPVMLIEEARLPAGFASLDEFKKQFSVPG